MKVCKTCGIEKSYSDYPINRQGKNNPIYKAHCKECYRKKQMERYYQTPVEDRRERRRKNRSRRPSYQKQYRLKSRYGGLTLEQFYAMIEEQDNMCKICGGEMNPPQVDHNHTTGKVRHLLCRPCNTSLGMLKENTDTLHNMISYINDNI